MELTLQEIARVSGGRLFRGEPFRRIKGISIDSRTIRCGELFIPLKGRNTDGHNFLKEAWKRKACAALIRRDFPLESIPKGLPFIRVHNPLRALGDIARYYRLKFNIPVIAVTGSCGKTTAKEMLAGILQTELPCLRSEKSFNNEIGVPLTVSRMRKGHRIAVFEIGTNRPGEIAHLTEICMPSVGVITNINPVHLEGLGSIENICKEKEKLLLSLPGSGVAVLNYDDVNLKKMGERFHGKLVTFGIEKKADFWADAIRFGESGTSFRLNGKKDFFLSLSGRAGVYNALAAISTASIFGISLEKMREALKSIKNIPHRLEILSIGSLRIVDDTYNANPASFRMAIDTLKDMKGNARCIVVAGDMLELGRVTRRAHYDVGYYMGKSNVDILIVTGNWAGELRKGAVRGGIKRDSIFYADSPEEISRIILNIVRPYDKILFKASRKIGLERAINVLSSTLSSL